MFALGYYAGCRASDVCWFRLDQVQHLTKKSGQTPLATSAGNCAPSSWQMKEDVRFGPTWKRSATRSRRTALLSSSHNALTKQPDVLVIIPGDSRRVGYMPGGVASKREPDHNNGSRSLTSPSMISATTSAIACVPLALLWKRWPSAWGMSRGRERQRWQRWPAIPNRIVSR